MARIWRRRQQPCRRAPAVAAARSPAPPARVARRQYLRRHRVRQTATSSSKAAAAGRSSSCAPSGCMFAYALAFTSSMALRARYSACSSARMHSASSCCGSGARRSACTRGGFRTRWRRSRGRAPHRCCRPSASKRASRSTRARACCEERAVPPTSRTASCGRAAGAVAGDGPSTRGCLGDGVPDDDAPRFGIVVGEGVGGGVGQVVCEREMRALLPTQDEPPSRFSSPRQETSTGSSGSHRLAFGRGCARRGPALPRGGGAPPPAPPSLQ